jgi:NAD(P)-dependent dehydrogenase (short-subunit alcohol dehydrogenase family)
VIDARRSDLLDTTVDELSSATTVIGIAGDVTDDAHRADLVDAAAHLGPVSLVVNNASTLGASPQPSLEHLTSEILRNVFEVNLVAPLALVRELAPHLAPDAIVVNISSDAAVEAYPEWGAYGASKAALDHAGRILAEERPDLRVLSVDPGDMRTEMHQAAFPGEDISDRPDPAEAIPGLLALIDGDQPSGRYRAHEVAPRTEVPT